MRRMDIMRKRRCMMFCVFIVMILLNEAFGRETSIEYGNIFQRTASRLLEDHMLRHHVIWQMQDISRISCMLTCNDRFNCFSFSYHSAKKVCKLHDVVFDYSDAVSLEVGWNHYLMKGCPNGWMFRAGYCYLFEISERKSWSDAKIHCQAHGGELMEISTQEKQRFTESVAMTLEGNFNISFVHNGFWIGGNDIDKEGEWVWSGTGKRIQYSAWHSGEPNSHGGDEDCIALLSRFNYEWIDYACNNKLHFICQRPSF